MSGSQINEKCNSCGACLPACPTKAISKGAERYVVDADLCTDCLLCAAVCPVNAIVNAELKPLIKKSPKSR